MNESSATFCISSILDNIVAALMMKGEAVEDDEEGGEGEKLDYDFLTYELEYLSMYGFRCPDSSRELYTMGEKGSNRNSNNNNAIHWGDSI